MSVRKSLGVFDNADGNEFKRRIKLEIRTSECVTCLAFNANTNKASVQVDACEVVKDLFAVEGTKRLEPIILHEIPVEHPGMTAAGHLTLGGPQSGDTGRLVVQSRNIDEWLRTGRSYDPVHAAVLVLQNGVFVPGLRPDPKLQGKLPITANVAELHHDAMIHIGRAADEFPVLGQAFLSLYNAMVATFNTHTHGYIDTNGPASTPGLTSPPTSTPMPVLTPITLDPMTPVDHLAQTIRIRGNNG